MASAATSSTLLYNCFKLQQSEPAMTVEIPVVPPGQNPYLVYLQVLKQYFGAGPGYAARQRVLILTGLNAVAIFLGLVYLGLLFFDARRKRTSGSLWLFRLIERPSGRYVVTNRNLWSGILGILTCSVIVARLLAYWYGFLTTGDQAGAGAWGSLTVIPIFLHIYMISWANLQSYMMLPERYDRHLITARTANSLFIAAGILFTSALFAVATAISVESDKAWYLYLNLRDTLSTRASTWNGQPISIVDLLVLEPYLLAATSAVDRYKKSIVIGASLLCFAPFFSTLINVASIALARVLRTQINLDLEAMRNPENGFSFTADSGISGMSDLSDMSGITAVTTSSKDSTEKYEEKVEKYDEKVVVVERMTRKYIRKIAKRNDDILGGGEQAKHIAMLQKAERDLLLMAVFMFFITLCSLILLLWTTISWARSTALNNSWSPVTTEICLFGIFWIYSITVSLTLICLIYNTVVHMTPASVPQPE